ncbi:MAG TPA: FAD-binding oxidoreductase [Longimicrobiales bacterium]
MLELLRGAIDAVAIADDVHTFDLHGVTPGSVVEPRTSAEAAAVLKLASENDWRVECAGAGTHIYGNRRTRADIVLTTRRMSSVVEYEPSDLVIGVQTGIPLRRLAETTAEHRQFLAQDASANAHSTVGAMLAAARSGPMRYSQGTPRDHALGLEVVTGDGRVLKVGGRVVKNVAGYDIVRLLVGSAGSLGLITSAYLRLKPIPVADETIALTASSAQTLMDIAESVVAENLEAAAIELLGPGVLGSDWTLLVRLTGNRESVADATVRLSNRGASAESAQTEVWELLQDKELRAPTVVRLADLPTRLPATMEAAQKLVDRSGAAASLMAHAGDGIVRLYFDAADAEKTAFAIGEARALVAVSGGTVIAHSRDAELMRRVDAFGSVGAAQPLMARLKQIFDPAGILAPGRFVS